MVYLFLQIMSLVLFSNESTFRNESELGLAAANGNSKTSTFNAVQLNEWQKDVSTVSFQGRYLLSSSNGVESAHFYQLKLRYAYALSDDFSLVGGPSYEKDKFVRIQHRYLFDLGMKYNVAKSERREILAEAGGRYMEERRYNGTKVDSKYGRLYSGWTENWNKNFSSKLWLEYLPNFSESKDYQANTEASLTAVLTDIFSIKTAFLLRYDNLPAPGARSKTDTLLTTALVAKF
jgi:putative salt-induced outer membrane protein